MKHPEISEIGVNSFRRMARELGLKPQHYTCTNEWIKDDANRLHIVQRYDCDGGMSVVLKQAFRPEDPTEFNEILDAHHRAQHALRDVSGLTVPQILIEDRPAMAYLMTFQPGETFLELCRSADDHTDYLRRAGQWLAAFHSNTFKESREFQPRFMAEHITMLADQIASGQRSIRGSGKFVKRARLIPGMVAQYSGRISKVAGKHGDLNAHNMLMDENTVTGFDFLAKTDAPVGYDIARFLLSYMESVGDIGAVPKGQVLPKSALNAFFEGYDFVPPDDPCVGFMLRVQVLTDWNRMPPNLNTKNLIRHARIKAIARQAFA